MWVDKKRKKRKPILSQCRNSIICPLNAIFVRMKLRKQLLIYQHIYIYIQTYCCYIFRRNARNTTSIYMFLNVYSCVLLLSQNFNRKILIKIIMHPSNSLIINYLFQLSNIFVAPIQPLLLLRYWSTHPHTNTFSTCTLIMFEEQPTAQPTTKHKHTHTLHITEKKIIK